MASSLRIARLFGKAQKHSVFRDACRAPIRSIAFCDFAKIESTKSEPHGVRFFFGLAAHFDRSFERAIDIIETTQQSVAYI